MRLTSNQTLLVLLAILLTAPISHAQAQVVTNSIGMKLQPMAIKVNSPLGKFSMGVYEVTQEQYEKVMGTNPSKFEDKKQNPVEMVNWNDAVAFCRKLSALPEEKKAGHVYRLPTEAEWDYACRAGTTTDYSFGDDESKLGEFAWYEENGGNSTHPVGQKKPNPWGLYDMHGNVHEWVSDSDDVHNRLYRSGSWFLTARSARSAYCGGLDPSSRFDDLGFRVARVPAGE